MAIDERECGMHLVEPVRSSLDTGGSRQIPGSNDATKFLARKQQRLDAGCDETQRKNAIN
jgi:hypothetical protein